MKPFRHDIILYSKGFTVRVCHKCKTTMFESNSGWFCTKCGRRVKRKWSSRLLYFFGIKRR